MFITIDVVVSTLNRYLNRVGEWCELWGMRLKASKTKTMIVSWSLTSHDASPVATINSRRKCSGRFCRP